MENETRELAVMPAEVATPGGSFSGALSLTRTPEAILADASRAAKALMAVVRRNGWEIKIGKGKHLKAEGWQMVGGFYGVTARTRTVRPINFGEVHGFEATVDAVSNGNVIGSATAICLNDEENWGVRPKYEWQGPDDDRKRVKVGEEKVPMNQLCSMAQTRAGAKALRAVFSWVVALAGYQPTPAEEMTGFDQSAAQSPPQQGGPARIISDPQRKRMYAIGKKAGWTDDEMKKLLARYGFAHSTEVTIDKYEEICTKLEQGTEREPGEDRPSPISGLP